jgi:hypothetical protein
MIDQLNKMNIEETKHFDIIQKNTVRAAINSLHSLTDKKFKSFVVPANKEVIVIRIN